MLAHLKKEVDALLESIEGRQFMAHANSILEGEKAVDGKESLLVFPFTWPFNLLTYFKDGSQDITASEAQKVALINRLDVFYEDQVYFEFKQEN
jgi:hypothetical protein